MNTYSVAILAGSSRYLEVEDLVLSLGGTLVRRGNKGTHKTRAAYRVSCSPEDARRLALLGAKVTVRP